MGYAGLNFLGGLGMGGLSEYHRQIAEDRQDRADALREKEMGMREQEFGLKMDEAKYHKVQRDQQTALDNAEAETLAPAAPKKVAVANYAGQDSAGRVVQKSAIQPDQAAAENALLVAKSEPGYAAPDGGITESSEPAYQVRAPGGNKSLYTGIAAAADAAKFAQENPGSSYSRHVELADKLASMPGGRKRSEEVLAKAREMRKEGAMDALHLLDQGKGDEAIALFNSMGTVKAPEGARAVTNPGAKDAFGKQGLHQLIGADGQVLVPDLRAYALSHVFSPHENVTLEHTLSRDAIGDKRHEDGFKLQTKVADAQIRHGDAAAKNQEEMLKLHREAAGRAANAASPSRKIAEIEKAVGRHLSQPEVMKLLGLGSDDNATYKFIDELITNGAKSGMTTPAEALKQRSEARSMVDMEKLQSSVAKAKAAGKATEVRATLKSNGASDALLTQLGL